MKVLEVDEKKAINKTRTGSSVAEQGTFNPRVESSILSRSSIILMIH